MARDSEEQQKPESIGLDSQPRARRDAVDLYNDIADRDTGRARRFTSGDGNERADRDKRENERHMSALARALQDPAYAAAYEQTKQTAEAARRATDAANARLEREAQQAAERLDEIQSNAARLADGRRVYRSADGRLLTEDGTDVSDQRDAVIGLTPNSSTYEELEEARRIADDIARRQREVQEYEHQVLAPVEQRLGDEDNPSSVEDLHRDRDRLQTDVPADVAAEYDAPVPPSVPTRASSAAASYIDETELPTPELNAQFTTAHNVGLPTDGAPHSPAPGAPKVS